MGLAQPGLLEGFAARTLGLRVFTLNAEPKSDNAYGVQVAERGIGTLNHAWISARYLDDLRIGADSEGFAYKLNGELSVGPRLKLTDNQGPLARVGIRGHWSREGALTGHELRLPTFELGYQYHRDRLQLELAATAGYALAGRIALPDSRPRLNGRWLYGGLLTASYDFLRLHGDLALSEVRGATVMSGHGHSCWLGSTMMVCLDGEIRNGASPYSTHVWSLGLSALWGRIEWLY